jgi:hypothetical protein
MDRRVKLKRLFTRWRPLLLVLACTPLATVCAKTTNAHSDEAMTQRPGPKAAAGNTAPESDRSATHSTEAVRTPDEFVRQFYAWYLGELREGKEPFKQEDKMKQYVTEAFIGKHASGPQDFDRALGLPKPESDWYNMKVKIGKPHYYNKKPLYDAYVDVTYKDFTDRGASSRGGTKFAAIEDQWSVGLQRTGAGWRIASIGIRD